MIYMMNKAVTSERNHLLTKTNRKFKQKLAFLKEIKKFEITRIVLVLI